MLRIRSIALLVATICMVGMAAHSNATPIDPLLDGNTSYDGWGNLTVANFSGYGSFPGTAAWPAPIGSNLSGSGDATLMKISNSPSFGGPYPASGSIYYGGFSGDPNVNGGVLRVTDNTPLANVSKVVFQIEIGEAFLYDFYNDVLPTFSYNGGSQALAADDWSLIDQVANGTVQMPTGPNGELQDEPIYLNTYMLEWDLTQFVSPISDFSIDWTGVQHAQLYSLRLDQTDFIEPPTGGVGVPEPASLGLVALGAALLGVRRRRPAQV